MEDPATKDLAEDLDREMNVLSRVLRLGEIPKDISAREFSQAYRAFTDVITDMLQAGGMNKTELDELLFYLNNLSKLGAAGNPSIETDVMKDRDKSEFQSLFDKNITTPERVDSLIKRMNEIISPFQQGGQKQTQDISSLRIDTGNDILVVLLDSDAAVPMFG